MGQSHNDPPQRRATSNVSLPAAQGQEKWKWDIL